MTPVEPDIGDEPTDGACKHAQTEMRFRVLSNGARSVQYQCLRCGQAASNAIKQATLTVEQLATLPAWDKRLPELYAEDQAARRAGERQKSDAEFEIERAERKRKYYEYLQSESWQRKRLIVLERDEYLCQGCRQARATQVHHLTYAHLFDELLFELTSVCDPCRRKCHALP